VVCFIEKRMLHDIGKSQQLLQDSVSNKSPHWLEMRSSFGSQPRNLTVPRRRFGDRCFGDKSVSKNLW